MKETLLVIDGNSILNRAFFGIRPLTNSKGLPTNALFGFANILLRHLENLSPDHAAVAFDLKAPTFRHKAFDGYKAGRKPMPEELALQLPYAKRLCAALGFRVLEKEGFEADDILGTLSAQAVSAGAKCYLLTGDRDSLQLINDSVSVLLAGNSETTVFDRSAFKAKYGVDPSVFVDVKALMGDSSDNIPGVKGVGEKTALALIAEYGSLDALYEGFETGKHPDKLKEKLRTDRENAFLSRFLAEIKKDVPLGVTFDGLRYDGFVRDELFSLLTELEFSAMIKRLGLEETASSPKKTVETKECRLAELPAGRYALTENEEGFSVSDGRTTFRLPPDELDAFLSSASYEKIFFDSKKYLRRALAGAYPLRGFVFDVMLAAYVLDPADGTGDLSRLAMKYLSRSFDAEKEDGAEVLFALAEELGKKTGEGSGAFLCREVEFPLAVTLADMEHRGFRVDREALESYGCRLESEANALERKIFDASGCEFNLNSPKQLGEVLFEKMALPHGKKTKSGYSTSAEILEKLRFSYPIVDDILEYRQLVKLKGTYTDGLVKVISEDGRIHTTFNQALTLTGRLSSAEPNLQNIPIRTEKGRELRRCFVPEKDCLLIDADYSQIELRILAHIADDRNMIEAFLRGDDIHTITASQVFGVSPESVTPELRKRAKAVNFGIVYGISDFSLAGDLGVSRYDAKDYIDSYLRHYSGIAAYLSGVVEEAKKKGYVETLFGRRRYLPELSSPKAMVRAFGERVAMNSPIQGSSADIIKLAMIRTEKALEEEKLDAHLILQVHDELVVEAHRDCAEKAAEILKREMENAFPLSLPLIAEVKIGENWLEAH